MNNKIYDLVIVGCGPAGLSAAINAKIRNLDFLLVGTNFCSPKLASAPEINNYLGFHNIGGEELRQKYLNHIQKMNIELKRARIDNIYEQKETYTLMARDQSFVSRSIILAVGVSNEKYLTGEEDFTGKGVSYCATCDGPLYRNKKVAMIVSTEEGMEEVDYMSEIVETVYLITDLDIDLNQYNNVKLIDKSPEALTGKNRVEEIKFKNGDSIEVDGVFILRKVTPPDKIINGLKTKNDHINTDKRMATNKDGVFAAGDCTGLPYQIGKAVGEGQVAALSAASYIYKTKNK